MTSYEMAIEMAKALDAKKGQNIKVLKTEELTTIADYFVLCTATSSTQVKAMSDACEEAMEKQGESVHHIEGHRDGAWLLMDFSSVIVHVFTDEARKFYDLERLWGDAQEIDLSGVLLPNKKAKKRVAVCTATRLFISADVGADRIRPRATDSRPYKFC